jgi:hypothetical protein
MIEDIEIRKVAIKKTAHIPLYPGQRSESTYISTVIENGGEEYRVKVDGVWGEWRKVDTHVIDRTGDPPEPPHSLWGG